MGKKTLPLASATSPLWIKTVLENFDNFLIDHANCERKANALLMSFIVKYPDRPNIIPGLIELAKEELDHFSETYSFMEKRGLQFTKDEPDPYINQLLAKARHGRDDRFIDRMLISSIVESRGAERFKIISDHVSDPELIEFYNRLWKSELKHSNVFLIMLYGEYPKERILKRLEELINIEAKILDSLEFRAALH
ncbi:MAG: tRNA-(ms[2]io[6]A)-hydroxylase [Pseudomonadota bacterium]|nr:tRNA-(ms[2]io[6]A)-hydroxylase [Pseudomonadota bacterium]